MNMHIMKNTIIYINNIFIYSILIYEHIQTLYKDVWYYIMFKIENAGEQKRF